MRSLLLLTAALSAALFAQQAPFRPPATPLITHDPYFSVWSFADNATDAWTQHWTGKVHALYGYVRVDGKILRVLGKHRYEGSPALPQTSLEVLPTRTIYEFAGSGIRLRLSFFTPAFPDDLEILARPITYLDWTVSSTDGQEHAVELYFDAGSDLTVNTVDQYVSWTRLMLDGQPVLRMGSREQRILAKRGDDLRIDWGYLYLMADRAERCDAVATSTGQARGAFVKTGRLPESDDFTDPVPTRRGTDEVLAISFDLGKVGAQPVSRFLMIGYDDLYSIEYFQRKQRPWWRRKNVEMSDLLRAARREHDALLARGIAFDQELMEDLRKAGGEKYARLAALAFRQTIAAHKLEGPKSAGALYLRHGTNLLAQQHGGSQERYRRAGTEDVAGAIGMFLGLVAGYFGGWINAVIMRINDALMSLPPIVLMLALCAALGGGLMSILISVGIVLAPTYCRLMCGQILALKNSDFVTAAKVIGAHDLRIMVRHLLPNAFPPLLVLISINLGTAIMFEATLSFLGIGIRPPTATWGNMVMDGYRFLLKNPVLSFAPGVSITLLVLAFNLVGDGLRDALDPRLRGTI